MSFTLAGHSFEGPYFNTSNLYYRSGVYVVVCGTPANVIDVGESANVRERVENHDRQTCWSRKCAGTLKYGAHYVQGEQQRKRVEQSIRKQYNPPCGEV